jgi:hypothetical protein
MNDTGKFTLPPEDKSRVMRLTQEVFVPHLQRAVEEARTQAPFPEVLSAAATAYADMLEATVGRQGAVELLEGLAAHIRNRPQST